MHACYLIKHPHSDVLCLLGKEKEKKKLLGPINKHLFQQYIISLHRLWEILVQQQFSFVSDYKMTIFTQVAYDWIRPCWILTNSKFDAICSSTHSLSFSLSHSDWYAKHAYNYIYKCVPLSSVISVVRVSCWYINNDNNDNINNKYSECLISESEWAQYRADLSFETNERYLIMCKFLPWVLLFYWYLLYRSTRPSVIIWRIILKVQIRMDLYLMGGEVGGEKTVPVCLEKILDKPKALL